MPGLAHIAGIPVEESALTLGPAALGLAGLVLTHVRVRIGRLAPSHPDDPEPSEAPGSPNGDR